MSQKQFPLAQQKKLKSNGFQVFLSRMIRLNLNEAVVPLELGNRIVGINEDMGKSIQDIIKTIIP